MLLVIAFRAGRRDNAVGGFTVALVLMGLRVYGDTGAIVSQANKCTWWMPRHRSARKDVASCEKLRGVASERRSGDIRMGQPGRGHTLSPLIGSQPRELKHLSTSRKRNQNEIP